MNQMDEEMLNSSVILLYQVSPFYGKLRSHNAEQNGDTCFYKTFSKHWLDKNVTGFIKLKDNDFQVIHLTFKRPSSGML